MDASWCFDSWADRIRDVSPSLTLSEWPSEEWWLYQDGRFQIAYAPMDWSNAGARIALVGITPGRSQAWLATKTAAEALRAGASAEDALQAAKSTAAFAGPMRRNLVSMLDDLSINERLGLRSCDELFGSASSLVASFSALLYPVFNKGKNYTGANLVRHPPLLALVRQILSRQVEQIPDALIVPLGAAVGDALHLLVRDGVLDPARCLWGFPHPSGLNGHRAKQFRERQHALQAAATDWFGAQSHDI